MSPVSKRIILFGISVLMALPVFGQQLVYDLRQEWVSYDKESKGFLPVNEKDYELNAIGFSVNIPGIDQFYLSIFVKQQAYLFHGSDLITTLKAGTTNLKIDSLKNVLSADTPFFTVYGSNSSIMGNL